MTSYVSLSARAAPVYRPDGRTPAARLRDLTRQARCSGLLGGPGLQYDADSWDLNDVLPRDPGPARFRNRQRLWFTATPGHRCAKPMQPVVVGFGKAYVRLSCDGLGATAIRSRHYAVRHLGNALAEFGLRNVTACTPAMFDRALALARKDLGEGALLAVAVQLETLARYMGASRLTKAPVGAWRHTATIAALPYGSSGPEFVARASARLPSDEFLILCAEAFRVSVKARDVIVSSLLALLPCAGVGCRIGELLRVPEDVRTARGLVIPGSKGAAEHDRAVLAAMSDLADRAVDRLLEVTAEARRIKRAYDKHPDRLYLPPGLEHLRGKAQLTMPEAAALVGMQSGCYFHNYVRKNRLELVRSPTPYRGAGHYLSFATVESHVLARLPEQMRRAGGDGYHPLLLVRWRQFSTATGSPCMFETFGYQSLHRSIRPIRQRPSMFKRQGLDDSGTVTGNTKEIRHLLNTIAHLCGLSPEDIAEMSGRVGTRHNRYYDHVPAEAPLMVLDGFARCQEAEFEERQRGD